MEKVHEAAAHNAESGAFSDASLAAIYENLLAGLAPQELRNRLNLVDDFGAPHTTEGIRLISAILDYRERDFDSALKKLTASYDRLGNAGDHRHQCLAAMHLAIVWYWKTDIILAYRWFSLAMSIAIRNVFRDLQARILCDMARLQMEMGDHNAAYSLVNSALGLQDAPLPEIERQRAQIVLLQSAVRLARQSDATEVLAILQRQNLPQRLQFLRSIEQTRLHLLQNEKALAQSTFEAAEALLPGLGAFDETELTHLRAELAFSQGDETLAMSLAEDALHVYILDDLVAREVETRKFLSRIADTTGDAVTANLHLTIALSRAIRRNLICLRDELSALLASRGDISPAASLTESGPRSAGTAFSQRFVIRSTIALGRFGAVRKAYDLHTGTEVVLKKFSLADARSHEERTRILEGARRELSVMSKLNHPNICRVQGILVDKDGDCHIVSEFIEGETLRKAIGTKDLADNWIDVSIGLCHALAALHASGFVYSDLKPDNVILRSGRPVLVDFETILASRGQSKMRAHGLTEAYAPPEQKRGQQLTPAADIFAFGIVMHEMMTGRLPTPRPHLWYLNPFDTSKGSKPLRHFENVETQRAARLFWKCLHPSPALRINSASDVLRELLLLARS